MLADSMFYSAIALLLYIGLLHAHEITYAGD